MNIKIHFVPLFIFQKDSGQFSLLFAPQSWPYHNKHGRLLSRGRFIANSLIYPWSFHGWGFPRCFAKFII